MIEKISSPLLKSSCTKSQLPSIINISNENNKLIGKIKGAEYSHQKTICSLAQLLSKYYRSILSSWQSLKRKPLALDPGKLNLFGVLEHCRASKSCPKSEKCVSGWQARLPKAPAPVPTSLRCCPSGLSSRSPVQQSRCCSSGSSALNNLSVKSSFVFRSATWRRCEKRV